ncbi:MAG: hypothetical protein ACREUI_01695 [Burkholderiales bacterium]
MALLVAVDDLGGLDVHLADDQANICPQIFSVVLFREELELWNRWALPMIHLVSFLLPFLNLHTEFPEHVFGANSMTPSTDKTNWKVRITVPQGTWHMCCCPR